MSITVMIDEHSAANPTGGGAQAAIAKIRAALVARYRVVDVPGRSEELSEVGTDRRLSLAYGCRTIRVRLQNGRTWGTYQDFQIPTDDDAFLRLKAGVFQLTDTWLNRRVPRPGPTRILPLTSDDFQR